MRRLRIVRTSAASMIRYRLRSAFMMLGTLVGVAMLTFVLSAGAAARIKLLATVRQLFGASSIMVSAGGGFFLGGPRDAARLTLDDVEAVVRDVPGIALWDPMQVAPETPVRRGERRTTVRLLGLSERSEEAWNRTTVMGRFFDATDVTASARVALLGETVVHGLFGDENPVGLEIRVGGVPFRVLGVLERFGTDIHGMDRDNEIIVPISTAMRRVMNVDSLRAVRLLAADPAEVETVTTEVVQSLRQRHGLADGQPNDFTVMTSVAVRRMVGRIERVLFVYLPLVAGISLLVAMAVTASLMLGSVSERTAEIGLRRAVGARPQDIRLQFLIESATVNLFGGILGLVAGSLLASIAAQRLGLDTGVSAGALLFGLGLSVLTGVLAGLAPARRAARLHPAEALR